VQIRRLCEVQVCGQEFSKETIVRIREVIDHDPEISRGALSRKVCEWLQWRTKKGQLKQVNCRVALLKLQQRGEIELPAVKAFPGGRAKRSRRVERKPQKRWKGKLEQLGPIRLIAIGSADRQAAGTWNQMMNQHHYLGAGPLCGAQMRYLIDSENYGYLGGLSFSAPAWRLESRDQWIGWDDRARRQNLNRVVANSRFLIVPQVSAPNLASHVLGMAVARIRADWMERYGEDLVLIETFVDRQRYNGTCYRAANWIEVGETKGRGRQDQNNRQEVPVKKVLLYALDKETRAVLCRCEGAATTAKAPMPEAKPEDWTEEEFGRAQLGDERLNQRLQTMARDFYANPQAQIPEACQSRAKTKAAYRFLGNPNTAMNVVLEPHYQATIQRIAKEKVVLSAQDTTSLNYSAHPLTNGIGPIGSKKDGGAIGLIVHDTIALTLEGTPLGLLNVQCWARDKESFGKHHQRKDKPIEQKESFKWLSSYQAAAEAQRQCPDTMIVSVGDREADIYELFELALEDPKGPRLLVRAEQDRLLGDGQAHLWPFVEKQPVAGSYQLAVPRRYHRPARTAQMNVRFAQIHLNPPKTKTHLKPVTLWAVLAEEIDPPANVEAICWMLLTTCPVVNFQQAMERIHWYICRWCIEVYHRTLKSGCKIEERQLGSACRIETCLAIDMVVAWRIFHLTKLGRETPHVPCTVFFEESEWKALHAYITRNPTPPAEPPTLQTTMNWVATLGGYRGRKGDGYPGTQTLWKGLQHLDDLNEMWLFMAKNYAPQLLSPSVSRTPT